MLPIGDRNPTRTTPFVNYVLLFANVGIFLFMAAYGWFIQVETGSAAMQRFVTELEPGELVSSTLLETELRRAFRVLKRTAHLTVQVAERPSAVVESVEAEAPETGSATPTSKKTAAPKRARSRGSGPGSKGPAGRRCSGSGIPAPRPRG